MSNSQLEEFLNDVKKMGAPVIVEGKRDRAILEGFGLRKIFAISGRNLAEVVEDIEAKGYREVIILTDFDEEGRKKFKLLSRLFRAKGIKINGKVRQKVKFLFKVGKIEELKFYLKDNHRHIT